MKTIDIIVLLAIFCPLLLGLIYLIIKAKKENKEMYEKLDDPVELYPVEVFKAKVVNKYFERLNEGSAKYPVSRNAHFMSFELEDGSVRSYEVDEVCFETVFYGETGELAVSDGKFLDFCKFE